jgi:hypothetical protein
MVAKAQRRRGGILPGTIAESSKQDEIGIKLR